MGTRGRIRFPLTKSSKLPRSAIPLSRGWIRTRRLRRTNSNTKRRNWKRCAPQSSPRCTKPEACQVVECPVVCQEVCPVVPQAVMHPLHLVDQLSKKLINRTKYARIRNYPSLLMYHFHILH